MALRSQWTPLPPNFSPPPQHGGKLPATFSEKDDFKKCLQRHFERAFPDPGKRQDVMNYPEAIENAYQAYVPYEVPYEVQEVLDHPLAADPAKAPRSSFWVHAAALRAFVAAEGGGKLPLAGVLPDMTASTDGYIQLQRAYHEKAEADSAAFRAHVEAVLAGMGQPKDSVPAEDSHLFCKNCATIQVVDTRSLAHELAPDTANTEELAGEIAGAREEQRGGEEAEANGDVDGAMAGEARFTQMPLAWHLTTRAADEFFAKVRRGPAPRRLSSAAPSLTAPLPGAQNGRYPGTPLKAAAAAVRGRRATHARHALHVPPSHVSPTLLCGRTAAGGGRERGDGPGSRASEAAWPARRPHHPSPRERNVRPRRALPRNLAASLTPSPSPQHAVRGLGVAQYCGVRWRCRGTGSGQGARPRTPSNPPRTAPAHPSWATCRRS